MGETVQDDVRGLGTGRRARLWARHKRVRAEQRLDEVMSPRNRDLTAGLALVAAVTVSARARRGS